MKKLVISTLCFCLWFMQQGHTQSYSQGDISAMQIINGYHDSTQCASFANQIVSFTIANSFLNDTLLIKDQFSGTIISTNVNTTGFSPWTFTATPMNMVPVVPDNMITGGFAIFSGNPMKFICGTDTIYNVNSFYQLPVNNPCTYGNISGRIYIDNNADCIFNSGDVALNSVPASAYVTLASGSGSQYGYSDVNGQYTMQIQQSWLTNCVVSIPSNYQFIFPSVTCSPASYTYTSVPQLNANFALQCTSQIDVQSAAFGPAFARPLIPFVVHPYVSNTGCDTASGTLTLVKDTKTIYNASLSSNPATYVNGDTLKWNFVNLTNLSSGAYWNSFMAGVYLTPNASVNAGDTLCFSVSSTVLSNDVNPANNTFSFCIPVVNSYDPNVKEVSPRGTGTNGQIPVTTDHLDYTIHFQNTGTAPAINIAVIDTLSSNVDASSLRILGSSHAMSAQWLTPNVVKFIFNGINLPDSATNAPKSQGQIRFSVKLKSGLTIGTQIKNKAFIYFDSNPAIVTNTTVNTLATPSFITEASDDAGIQLYPNPVENQLFIQLPSWNKDQVAQVAIYSINNQLIRTIPVTQSVLSIDTRAWSQGIYIVKITQNDRTEIRKVIKQ